VDRFRRLDEAGRATARQLVWALADREITQIVSSPLVRCVESVVPLAQSRGLVVEDRWELAPDASLDDLMTLLVDLPDTAVACTHREAFENLLGWDVTCEKGAAWVLERNGSELVPALYVAPPTTVGVGQRQAV
jgi:8-oxo-dGTP diphosphatase